MVGYLKDIAAVSIALECCVLGGGFTWCRGQNRKLEHGVISRVAGCFASEMREDTMK